MYKSEVIQNNKLGSTCGRHRQSSSSHTCKMRHPDPEHGETHGLPRRIGPRVGYLQRRAA